MTEQADYLRYAVRPGALLKYFGQACLILALLTLAPLLVCVVSGDMDTGLRYMLVVAVLSAAGALLRRLPEPGGIQMNESLVLGAGLFLFSPLIAVFPMMGTGQGFQAAFFEAVSGATTTGLSTLSTLEGAPSSFLFARAWMQWYGGLGIMVLSVALVVRPGLAAKGLAAREIQEGNLVGGARPYVRRVLLVYCILTLLGVTALIIVGTAPFEALLYTLSSVSTGGFSPHGDSLSGLEGWPARTIVLLVCVSCAVALVFYHDLLQKGRHPTVNFLQLKALMVIGIGVTILFAAALYAETGLPLTEIMLPGRQVYAAGGGYRLQKGG